MMRAATKRTKSMRLIGASSFPCDLQVFLYALGRTRTCDLLIRSQTRSRTRGDIEGHRGTKQRFYQGFITLEGTGRDRERHGVVVPLWYEKSARWPTVLEAGLKLIRSVRAAGF